MGISGLLPALKSSQQTTHIKNYKGFTFAVDGYVWLHRGAFSCAADLAQGRFTSRYVDYAMRRIGMLQHFGVVPYVVLDGGYLPSKAKTEDERQARRAENLRKAESYKAQGNSRAAMECYQKCIDITPEMALRFIRALQKAGVQYVVAPYEADAQLAYLEREGIVDGVITEDSDLLVYGCRRVLYKLNDVGECFEILRDRIARNTGLTFAGWTDEMFRYMAILSGCDYLDSIPGMGLKRAHRIVKKYRDMSGVMRAVRMDAGLRVPSDYDRAFALADLTFRHQRVYCPRLKALRMFTEPSERLAEDALALIGADMPPEMAEQVARGELNPISRELIVLPEEAVAGASTSRPPLRQSQSAPALRNHAITEFLKPQRQLTKVELAPARPPLEQINGNTAPRRSPPKTLTEQRQAEKLSLFDSSPSPARKRHCSAGSRAATVATVVGQENAPISPLAKAFRYDAGRSVTGQENAQTSSVAKAFRDNGECAAVDLEGAPTSPRQKAVGLDVKRTVVRQENTPIAKASQADAVQKQAVACVTRSTETTSKFFSRNPAAPLSSEEEAYKADIDEAVRRSLAEAACEDGVGRWENPLRFDLESHTTADKVATFFQRRPPPVRANAYLPDHHISPTAHPEPLTQPTSSAGSSSTDASDRTDRMSRSNSLGRLGRSVFGDRSLVVGGRVVGLLGEGGGKRRKGAAPATVMVQRSLSFDHQVRRKGASTPLEAGLARLGDDDGVAKSDRTRPYMP
ncbi:Rad2 nuclease [Savitreella phatthalungensis]